MKNYKPILIIFFALFLAYEVNGQACTTPVENLSIAANTVLCSGTYQLNDTNPNGVIRITASGVTVTCNGTKFVGYNVTNSKAFDGNFMSNFNISGCEMKDYKYGIYSSGGDNVTIYNNTFGYSVNYAVQLLNAKNSYILNNVVTNGAVYGFSVETTPYSENESQIVIYKNNITGLTGASSEGIKLLGIGNSNISYNTIVGSKYAIETSYVNRTLIENNIVSNTTSTGIRINSDFSYFNILRNNVANYTAWNCIDVQGAYSNFTNNRLDNCNHSALNSNTDDDDRAHSFYNLIGYNVVSNSGICAYLDGISNSIYYNNSCSSGGKYSDAGYSSAFAADGVVNSTNQNITTHTNLIENNTITGYTQYAFRDHSINSSNRYRYNIITSTNATAYGENYYGSGGDTLILYFYNNTETDDFNFYYFGINKKQNVSILDVSSKSYINLEGTRNLFFNYSSSHNVNITNQSVYVSNLTYPYNDYYNGTYQNEVSSFSATLSSGQAYVVGDYLCDKHYRDSSIRYNCNATACYFTNTNCTVKQGRTN